MKDVKFFLFNLLRTNSGLICLCDLTIWMLAAMIQSAETEKGNYYAALNISKNIRILTIYIYSGKMLKINSSFVYF